MIQKNSVSEELVKAYVEVLKKHTQHIQNTSKRPLNVNIAGKILVEIEKFENGGNYEDLQTFLKASLYDLGHSKYE